MIFGTIVLNDSGGATKKFEIIRNILGGIGGREIPFTNKNFAVSIFLHSGLPYETEDFFFLNTSKNILVLLAGNIYNRSELINENGLSEKIKNGRLVYELFVSEGPSFVEKLNGDFAILIYLPKINEGYLFRDHIGIYPLAYTIENNNLFFSCDILSLCRTFFDQKTIFLDPLLNNEKAVNHLLTINPKIKKLIPGHYLYFSEKEISVVKYWFPEKIITKKNLQFQEMIERAEFLLKNAITIRCDDRFRAGAHVSGGIDSSLVAAIARNIYKNQPSFWAFSWSPDGPAPEGVKDDERILIREIGRQNNMNVDFSTPDKRKIHQLIKNYYFNSGYFLEELTLENAQKNNVNLIFSGWGGDEFLSKHGSGIDSDLFFEFRLKKFFERNPLRKPRKLAKTLFFFVFFPALGILDFSILKSYRDSTRYFKRKFQKNDRSTIKKFFFYRSRRERHLNFIYNYYLSERAEINYHLAFRKGIEFRYPLLDKRIIEFMLQVPSHLLVRKELDRVIVRDLGKGWLPESMWNRKSFIDPVLTKNKAAMVREIGRGLIYEIKSFEKNPDLAFVNWKKVYYDVEKAKKNPSSPRFNILYSNLLSFKMLHEFTKTYRSLPPESE